MICSHLHKFVFIKTAKTASTSIEMGLERFCGPQDIVTPIWHDSGGGSIERPGRNYQLRFNEFTVRDLASFFYRWKRPAKFANHEAARDAKAKLGSDVWEQYVKFTIVRNPFDRAVSMYYWLTKDLDSNSRPPLYDWICNTPIAINNNWLLYTENDVPLVDDFVRFENLQEDLVRIGQRIGLPGNLYEAVSANPMKTTQRPRDAAYRKVINERTRELISHLCHKEIAKFGYEF